MSGARQSGVNTPNRKDSRRVHPAIEFAEQDGVYSGVGARGRRWTISACLTGWRLEFQDPGDMTRINAGVHRTPAAAMAAANG